MSELGCALATRDGKLLGEGGLMPKEGMVTKGKLMLLIASVPCFGDEHEAACPERIMGSCGQVAKMDFCAIGKMADWLLANGVTFATDNNVGGKWIPVTERLPAVGQRVLVYCESRTIEKHVTVSTYMRDYSNKRGSYFSRRVQNVTHWMPLPEPPKEGE